MSNSTNTESQSRMIELCEQINQYKPEGSSLNDFSIGLIGSPEEVRQQVLATPLGNMLLEDGASLAIEESSDYYPDIDMHIGSAVLKSMGLVVHKSTWPRHNEVLYGLSVRFGYVNRGGEFALEEVGAETSTLDPQAVPRFYGKIWAGSYAETGYEGHNIRTSRPTDEQALDSIVLLKELFDRHSI